MTDAVELGLVRDLNQRMKSELRVILALLLYPTMMRQLLEKIGKKQLTQVFKKSYYEGY